MQLPEEQLLKLNRKGQLRSRRQIFKVIHKEIKLHLSDKTVHQNGDPGFNIHDWNVYVRGQSEHAIYIIRKIKDWSGFIEFLADIVMLRFLSFIFNYSTTTLWLGLSSKFKLRQSIIKKRKRETYCWKIFFIVSEPLYMQLKMLETIQPMIKEHLFPTFPVLPANRAYWWWILWIT